MAKKADNTERFVFVSEKEFKRNVKKPRTSINTVKSTKKK